MDNIRYTFPIFLDHYSRICEWWELGPIPTRKHIPYKRLIKIPKTSKCKYKNKRVSIVAGMK